MMKEAMNSIEQVGVCGKVWREGKEEGNNVITL